MAYMREEGDGFTGGRNGRSQTRVRAHARSYAEDSRHIGKHERGASHVCSVAKRALKGLLAERSAPRRSACSGSFVSTID